MAIRNIVHIDEDRCDGCGQCVTACAEGAIQVIDGKARLVSEVYCDGLGACLGDCPQGAITIEERDAEAFDPEAVHEHLGHSASAEPAPCQCPGSAIRALLAAAAPSPEGDTPAPSQLTNWPVQLRLVPVQAPFLQGARLLITADCVPFALAGFHSSLLAGRALLIGCPKLDDAELYRHKLAQMLARNDIASVEVVHMEVPCCHGLVRIVAQALADSGKTIPATVTEITIGGGIVAARPLAVTANA